MQVPIAHQADEAIAQVLTLKKHEDQNDDDEPGGRQRTDERKDQVLQHFQRLLAGDNLHGQRIRLRRLTWTRSGGFLLLDLAPDPLDHPAQSFHNAAACAHILERSDLGQDIELVGRDVARQFADLRGNDNAEQGERRESEQHAADDGDDTRDAEAPERGYQRRQREGEQQRHGDRQKDVPSEIQGSDRAKHGGSRRQAGMWPRDTWVIVFGFHGAVITCRRYKVLLREHSRLFDRAN